MIQELAVDKNCAGLMQPGRTWLVQRIPIALNTIQIIVTRSNADQIIVTLINAHQR
jgi:hypothetical protein